MSNNNKENLLDLLLNGSITKDVYNNRLKALINNDIINHNAIDSDHRVRRIKHLLNWQSLFCKNSN